ncbi:MAG TPA: carboxypeptidase-like regulatory domain-containing protein, partial [Terriglobales bacterium]|nr:carboxypeptidase-like regulatory domain-containing protein [Terriglobales bacterium]
MNRCFLFRAFLVAALAITINSTAQSQTSSGQISGRVLDSAGAVVSGADVAVTNQATGDTRKTKTDPAGNFIFLALQPGTFTVSVEAPNFKKFDKKDLHLTASERLSAGDLRLEVGQVSQTVSVTAEATTVQTESAERSALLDSKEMSTLMSVGRDPLSLLRVLPGIVGAGDSNGRDDDGDGLGGSQLGTSGPGVIAGVRSSSNAVSIDGVSGNPRGDGNKLDTPLNMDAVA